MTTTDVHIDPDALTDGGPNLGAVTVVAAVRGISVTAAREQLLTEWDQRLAGLILTEADMAEQWLARARDYTIAGDQAEAEAENSITAARECAAAQAAYADKRRQCAAMRRFNTEHPTEGENYR